LIKSNQKSRQQAGFFAAPAFTLQTGKTTGWNIFTPCFAAPGLRFCKNFLCPAIAPATIVLPVSAEAFLL
jgi:hypothetical protein